tara:strand:+ start:286 stop:921 length:636 start_codon:yes stop_codon:yes gene_type:complete
VNKHLTTPSRKKILEHFDRNDSKIATVIRSVGPFKLRYNRKYFQVLCKAIIAQQISTIAAEAVTNRFYNLFERRLPTPERVFALSQGQLQEAGLSRQKASYLKDLSKHFIDKFIKPHRLPYLSNEDIIQQLTAVHGIGRWTADMFLIFSLHRLDILPVGDLGFRAALKKIYKLKKLPTAKKIRQMAKPWNPWETIATWYCWRTLDAKIIRY